MKTEMQREYEQLCRIDENPGVQGLAQLGRNAINRVSRLESQLSHADARIAELEREIERLDAQWREELRIYRETDGVDAERYRYLRGQAPPVPGECKRHIAVHVYDWARSFNQSDRFNMWSYVELSGDRLDAEIDAARANGGGG